MPRTILILAATISLPALAQPISITNPGFESPAQTPGGYTVGSVPGWTVAAGGGNWGVFYPTVASWSYTASSGNQVLYTNGPTIEQATTHQVLPSTTYTLCVEVVNRPTYGGNNYTIELYAGSTLLAADNNSLHPPVGGFLTSAIQVTTPASGPAIGQPLKIRLGGANQTNFDNVRLSMGTAPCPLNCYPNCDGSTTAPILNVQDFSCFLNRFQSGNTWANCDGSTTPPILNVQDFSCFLNRFGSGCT